MLRNLGKTEQVLRGLAGLTLLLMACFSEPTAGWRATLVGIGAGLLVTVAVGFCPVWRMLGISTCRTPARRPR